MKRETNSIPPFEKGGTGGIKIPLNPPLLKGDLLEGCSLEKRYLLRRYSLESGAFGGRQAKNS